MPLPGTPSPWGRRPIACRDCTHAWTYIQADIQAAQAHTRAWTCAHTLSHMQAETHAQMQTPPRKKTLSYTCTRTCAETPGPLVRLKLKPLSLAAAVGTVLAGAHGQSLAEGLAYHKDAKCLAFGGLSWSLRRLLQLAPLLLAERSTRQTVFVEVLTVSQCRPVM